MKTHYSYTDGNLVQVCRNAHDPRRGARRPSITRDVLAVTCAKCLAFIGPDAIAKARAEAGKRYETREVLAGAYRDGASDSSMLTHTVDIQNDDAPLCSRVKADHIADGFSMEAGGIDLPPTCPTCRRRDPRFPREA